MDLALLEEMLATYQQDLDKEPTGGLDIVENKFLEARKHNQELEEDLDYIARTVLRHFNVRRFEYA
jgi:hypothetical protein